MPKCEWPATITGGKGDSARWRAFNPHPSPAGWSNTHTLARKNEKESKDYCRVAVGRHTKTVCQVSLLSERAASTTKTHQHTHTHSLVQTHARTINLKQKKTHAGRQWFEFLHPELDRNGVMEQKSSHSFSRPKETYLPSGGGCWPFVWPILAK